MTATRPPSSAGTRSSASGSSSPPPALNEVGKIVRAPHERWDGRGYPDGLAGTEIPLAARIISVCDAYSAMTDQRAYGTVATSEEAVAELRRSAGTQFDAEIVKVVCALDLSSAAAEPRPRQLAGPQAAQEAVEASPGTARQLR